MSFVSDDVDARAILADEASDEIERLRKRNALLEDVAVAAESQRLLGEPEGTRLIKALDKLHEVGNDEGV